jgi:ATP-independent RNA helicase DbpA
MVTIQLDSGRKNKIRPGDLLGALTGDAGLSGSQIGKIDIFDISSYVAVERSALSNLSGLIFKQILLFAGFFHQVTLKNNLIIVIQVIN